MLSGVVVRLAVLLTLLCACALGLTPEKVWGDTLPVAASGVAEANPAIAFNASAGRYLVVWESAYSDTDYDIAARHVGLDGAPVGDAFSVIWSGAFENAPAVAYSSASNQYLVVWQERVGSDEFAQNDIHARRLDANGNVLGEPFVIANDTRSEDKPAVAYNPAANEYLVVWERRWTADDHDILARRISGAGVPLGTGPMSLDASAEDQLAPAVAFDANAGQYLIVWQDKNPDTQSYDIHGRRILGNGTAVGDEITIAAWEYDLIEPRTAFNSGANQFLVVWEDHRWGWGEARDIYGQRIAAGGALVGGNFSISWEGDQARTRPDVAYDAAANEYLVVWEYAASPDDMDVYRRRVNIEAGLPDSEVAVSRLGTHEGHPRVASSGDLGYLTVWEDNRQAPTNALDVYGASVPLYRFSGRVFQGLMGDESTPLAGIEVALHCSNNPGEPGAVVDTRTTDPEGWYGLLYANVCEFYNLVEVDPEGYLSAGASTVGGTVIDGNWIQYSYPIGGKVLTGNKFWDTTDPAPGEWQSFVPADWVRSQTVAAAIRVRDVGSGLDVSSAQYAYSTTGGSSWSAWQPAGCTGADGSTAFETVSASNVYFGQDSGANELNRIRFRIADLRGNWGTSEAFGVQIDTTPPTNPQLQADRPTATWSASPTVQMTWSGASDATSGVAGFSYQWSPESGAIPDTTLDTTAGSAVSTIPGEGSSWYFSVRTVDVAGNWAASATRLGPFYLDSSAPTNPATVESTTHSLSTWTSQNNVTWAWSAGYDGLSGLAGYSYLWNQSPSTVPDLFVESAAQTVTSGTVGDGLWYFHLRAVDNVGIGAATAVHRGPYNIDTAPPSSQVSPLPALQTSASFPVAWVGDPGAGAPITSYDVKVTDEYGGDSTTSVWLSGTTSTGAVFPGQTGHTYKFFSRAVDAAGNQESYAADPDTVTTVIGDVSWIHFEESGIVAGQRIDEAYASLGVHFVNDYMPGRAYRASPTITSYANARTSPNVLVNNATGGEFFSSANVPLVAWFDQPVSGVGMWLGSTQPGCTAQATVSLRDCEGNVRASKTASVGSAFDTSMELSDPTGSAQLLVVDYGASTCPEAIDELAFADGPGQCLDVLKPKVTITYPTDFSSASATPIALIGTVEDTSGILRVLKVNGSEIKFTPDSGSPGKYSFSASADLEEGGNTITVFAIDGAGNAGSALVTVNYGAPATITLEDFHLTQRGIMQDESCDLDEPFVAGKFTIARGKFDVRTASGASAFFDSVVLSLYRKMSSGDVLVDTIPGEQYSPQVSQFDSPAQMAGVHFWIPAEAVDLAGEYTMRFQAYVGVTPIGPQLEVPCQDKYFNFAATKSLNILIQPVEAQLFSPNLPKNDHELFFKILDLTARMYPIREGYSLWYQNENTGIRYGYTLPYEVCDGSAALHQKQPDLCKGTGFEWTFKDTDPSGIWRVDHASKSDPTFSDCANPPRTTIGGKVTGSTLKNLPRPTIFGLFRGGEPGAWGSRKYAPIYDDSHDGFVVDDLPNYVAEFRNLKPDTTFEWITDLKQYDQGEVYRTFVDADGNACWDSKNETSAPIAERWLNVQTQLWGPQGKALNAFNKYVTWTPFKMDHAVLWFPDAFHPNRKDFGMFDPGQGHLSGNLVWIRPGDGGVGYNNVLPHEMGHNFGLNHTTAAQTPITAWQAYVRDKQVSTTGLTSSMASFMGQPDTRFFNDANYKTLFDALKLGTTAAAAMPQQSPGEQALVVSGMLDPAGEIAFVDTAIENTVDGLSPPDPTSPYSLLQGAGATVLSATPFPVQESYDPPVAIQPEEASAYAASDQTAAFRVEAPLAVGIEWVEIVRDGQVLHHLDRSFSPPTVQVVQPNGGEIFGPDEPLLIEWFGDDSDGDDLEYVVSYSTDGGETWILLASGLGGVPLAVATSDIPGSQQALIRVRASDGFNESEDQSDAVFSVAGKPPMAAIVEPETGSTFREWDHVSLRGQAVDAESGTLEISWLLDGDVVGAGAQVRLDPLPAGTHVVQMQVTDGDGQITVAEAGFQVLADSDRDGMEDAFEETNGLDPGFAGDAAVDTDGDGLTNFDEAARGLDPTDEDTDDDGVWDGIEIVLGTDPRDRDSDDDGLADGAEDANGNGVVDAGETDPVDSDSDGDGIADGVELGVTEPLPDPDGDGPLVATNVDNFRADADPTTTTNPLASDSDSDGVADAIEDADRNGRVDPWETDPADGSWYREITHLTLQPGFNLIAIPGKVTSLTHLSDWLPYLGDSGDVERVAGYDNRRGRFITLVPGQTAGEDMAVEGGEGVIIYASRSTLLTFDSIYCQALDLGSGLNLVGFACPPASSSAFVLLNALGSQNVAAVQRFRWEKGAWESAVFGPGDAPAGIDFPLIRGEGYLLQMKEPVPGFRP